MCVRLGGLILNILQRGCSAGNHGGIQVQRMQVLNYLGERGGGFGIHLISSFSGTLIGFQADDHAMVFCSALKTKMKREMNSCSWIEDIERD